MIIALFGTTVAYSQNKQQILESVLKLKEITELLSLKDLDDRGPIRFFDRTNQFSGVQFLFKLNPEQKGVPINVGVLKKLPIDLNTGHFCDVVISGFEKKGKLYVLDLYLSNYLCYDKKKNKLHFTITLQLAKTDVIVNDVSFAEWH